MGQQNNKEICCNNTNKSTSQTLDDLVYYMTVDDNLFGKIPVYTSSKKPSCYVAKIERQFQNSNIFNLFQKIQNHQLNCLASLHAFQIQRQKYFTGHNSQKITAYWEYYNYYFTDYIKMRSLKKIPFTQRQIWFVIKNCAQSFSLFNQYNLVLDLDIKNIMIIPEGKIKLYWHHIQSNNQHLKFYQTIRQQLLNKRSLRKQPSTKQFISYQEGDFNSFYFSPEQINGIQKRQLTVQIDFARANSFRLGMILLYCITFTDPIKTCYGRANQRGKNRIKIMVLNSLYQNKVQYSTKYSQDLKHLIKLLLLQDPNKRIPITCLQNVYQKYMSQEAELMMGMTDNPFQIQSSSRKNLNQNYEKQAQLSNNRKNTLSSNYRIQQLQRKQSQNGFKLQPQINNRSSRRILEQNYRQQRQQQNRFVGQYDKFDTKTVKILSSYHKPQR